MASTNQSPFYQRAAKNFLEAETPERKIHFLEEMIKECPKHKSSENMLANLKTRYKKLKAQLEKSKKSGKSSFKGVKKEDMQAVIIGLVNTGKSTLISKLSNAKPTISEVKFSTTHPVVGMMSHASVPIQLVENPAVFSEYYDKGIIHTADTILILITELDQIKEILPLLEKAPGKRIVIFNSFDKTPEEIRKIRATLKSKKHNYFIINLKTQKDLEELKEKIFQSFDNLRIFTKEPGKEKSNRPMILKPGSTVEDVSEKILKGFSKTIKEIKIWGPSSKFAGQKVGPTHKIKDLDIIEFRTK